MSEVLKPRAALPLSCALAVMAGIAGEPASAKARRGEREGL